MLAGIVVNNAIVLVDAVNRRRREGEALDEAIVGAGRERLRPILMTTATTVLALLPMALGLGAGDELRAPAGDHRHRRPDRGDAADPGGDPVPLPGRWPRRRCAARRRRRRAVELRDGAPTRSRAHEAHRPAAGPARRDADAAALPDGAGHGGDLPCCRSASCRWCRSPRSTSGVPSRAAIRWRPARGRAADRGGGRDDPRRQGNLRPGRVRVSATIEVQFDWGVDIDLKKMEVREAVERARDPAARRHRPHPRRGRHRRAGGGGGPRRPHLGRARPVRVVGPARPADPPPLERIRGVAGSSSTASSRSRCASTSTSTRCSATASTSARCSAASTRPTSTWTSASCAATCCATTCAP